MMMITGSVHDDDDIKLIMLTVTLNCHELCEHVHVLKLLIQLCREEVVKEVEI